MYLYIDTYFILNLAVDYLILLATARLRALSIHRLRTLLAALLGAAYAVLGAVLQLPFLGNPFMILAVGALMLLVAFGGTDGLLPTALVFVGVAAAFGGFALALARLTGGLRLDLGILLLALPVCYIVLKLAFSRRAARTPEKARVELGKDGRLVSLDVLGDSGNLLQDPVSGDRVLVAEAGAVKALFAPETAALLCREKDPGRLLERLGPGSGFRLVPYGSVGGSGLLPAFRPEKVVINGKLRRDILVAVTPSRLSDTNAFQGILGGAF